MLVVAAEHRRVVWLPWAYYVVGTTWLGLGIAGVLVASTAMSRVGAGIGIATGVGFLIIALVRTTIARRQGQQCLVNTIVRSHSVQANHAAVGLLRSPSSATQTVVLRRPGQETVTVIRFESMGWNRGMAIARRLALALDLPVDLPAGIEAIAQREAGLKSIMIPVVLIPLLAAAAIIVQLCERSDP